MDIVTLYQELAAIVADIKLGTLAGYISAIGRITKLIPILIAAFTATPAPMLGAKKSAMLASVTNYGVMNVDQLLAEIDSLCAQHAAIGVLALGGHPIIDKLLPILTALLPLLLKLLIGA